MQCFHPIKIKPKLRLSGKYEESYVPCGRCAACLENYRNSWVIRLKEQLRDSSTCFFVTLSYDDYYLPSDNSVHKEDLQKFFKRLRQNFKLDKIKYFAVGEYGFKASRPHYHCIIFNLPDSFDEVYNLILKSWGFGFVTISPANDRRLSYTTMYSIASKLCDENYNKCEDAYQNHLSHVKNFPNLKPLPRSFFYKDLPPKPFALMSKNLGMGYIKRSEKYHRSDLHNMFYTDELNRKFSLPRYYRDRLFNPDELEDYRNLLSQRAIDNLDSHLKHKQEIAFTNRLKSNIKHSKSHL